MPRARAPKTLLQVHLDRPRIWDQTRFPQPQKVSRVQKKYAGCMVNTVFSSASLTAARGAHSAIMSPASFAMPLAASQNLQEEDETS